MFFSALDTNHDGSLTRSELSCGLSDFGFDDSQIDELMTKLDANRDGKISKDEFVSNFGETEESCS